MTASQTVKPTHFHSPNTINDRRPTVNHNHHHWLTNPSIKKTNSACLGNAPQAGDACHTLESGSPTLSVAPLCVCVFFWGGRGQRRERYWGIPIQFSLSAARLLLIPFAATPGRMAGVPVLPGRQQQEQKQYLFFWVAPSKAMELGCVGVDYNQQSVGRFEERVSGSPARRNWIRISREDRAISSANKTWDMRNLSWATFSPLWSITNVGWQNPTVDQLITSQISSPSSSPYKPLTEIPRHQAIGRQWQWQSIPYPSQSPIYYPPISAPP